jgi:hypothetical protein
MLAFLIIIIINVNMINLFDKIIRYSYNTIYSILSTISSSIFNRMMMMMIGRCCLSRYCIVMTMMTDRGISGMEILQ